jgi:hypothetical protein
MIMVLLILKLFVSSRPLKLEGVLCIYILLFYEGQDENHLYVFPYNLDTRLTFIVLLFMIFCLCFFSYYNMVDKFLLSRLCLLCLCFKFFDPSTQCFTQMIKIVMVHITSKIILLLSLTYSRTSRS